MIDDEQGALLQAIAGVLIRSFLMTFALLMFWFVLYLALGDFGYDIHSKWFELSKGDYSRMNYYGMAFIKVCGTLFFLFPYLSIKLVLSKKKA